MRKVALWAPLAVFALLVLLVAFGLLRPSEHVIASKMVGKPAPAFALPPALPGKPGLDSAALTGGGPRLVNIFASWCVPCAAEAPILGELKKRGVVVEGIAIRDRPEDLAAFLARWGDPFARIGADRDSRVQMAFGSSGVPESFVVDARGVIRHQHIGAINPEDVPEILAAIEAAR
ncbi:MAG: DsbE family thiol:disulfide interchange protein [Sphingomonas sanxanigenens]|uniref:DsbE family thiol:disulfide interchange protein n=1 Tax=Sphingomonas sanxanigenens TaxID=397260 RepID=A0A2W5A8N1_9SPHN|nr:MAG: DsbE family thiol:disulfide interchange protein [Sphingomonas sanxanigenens]